MKILIVDDELVSRIKLQTILEGENRCHLAQNGVEAMQNFRQAWKDLDPYDLVCLDIGMPDKNGMDVLFEIREAEADMQVTREKPVKILMITSHADKDSIITSIQAGCDGYLVKPFNNAAVLNKIKELGLTLKKSPS